MLKPSYPYYLANKPVAANTDLAVDDKFSGKPATRVALADAKAINQALDKAVAAVEPMRKMPAYQRQDVLNHCVRRFNERKDELAEALCIEAGKPIKDSRGEVTRLIDTFRIAAEESRAHHAARCCRSISRRARADYSGMWKRVPDRAVLVHLAVQFPAEPRCAQGRAGARGGLPVRAEAREPDADRRADHRRGARRDETSRGRVLDPAVPSRRTRICSPTTSASSCSASPARPRSAGTSRRAPARRRSCSSSAATRPCIVDEDADLDDAVARIDLRRVLPVRPELHQACSASSSTSTIYAALARQARGARRRS